MWYLLLSDFGSVEKTGIVVVKLIEGERTVIRTVRTMEITILLDGETIIRKVLRGNNTIRVNLRQHANNY